MNLEIESKDTIHSNINDAQVYSGTHGNFQFLNIFSYLTMLIWFCWFLKIRLVISRVGYLFTVWMLGVVKKTCERKKEDINRGWRERVRKDRKSLKCG